MKKYLKNREKTSFPHFYSNRVFIYGNHTALSITDERNIYYVNFNVREILLNYGASTTEGVKYPDFSNDIKQMKKMEEAFNYIKKQGGLNNTKSAKKFYNNMSKQRESQK